MNFQFVSFLTFNKYNMLRCTAESTLHLVNTKIRVCTKD